MGRKGQCATGGGREGESESFTAEAPTQRGPVLPSLAHNLAPVEADRLRNGTLQGRRRLEPTCRRAIGYEVAAQSACDVSLLQAAVECPTRRSSDPAAAGGQMMSNEIAVQIPA